MRAFCFCLDCATEVLVAEVVGPHPLQTLGPTLPLSVLIMEARGSGIHDVSEHEFSVSARRMEGMILVS